MKKIGVLNLQGAVDEHLVMLKKTNLATPILVRYPDDLSDLDGLIIPGGESTAISRLIQENSLFEPLKHFAKAGKGIWGTCAGLVICGHAMTGTLDKRVNQLQLIDITVQRNGFGRQIHSFETELNIKNIGDNIPAIFIRAPYIHSFSESVTPLAYIDKYCVMAQQDNILVCSFHPELAHDLRIIHYFLSHVC